MTLGFRIGSAVSGLVFMTTSSVAAVIPLGNGQPMSALVGNSFVVGNLEFFVDSYNGNIPGSAVTVTAANFGLAGQGFDMVGQWNDPPGDTSATGFTLQYRVVVRTPGIFITDNHLQFNGFAFAPGSFATVNESVFNSQGQLLGNKLVFANGGLPPSQWVLEDFIVFPPQLSVQVVKDFSLFANGASGIANASFIRQTFSQIPTPGAAAMYLVAGLAALRRRR